MNTFSLHYRRRSASDASHLCQCSHPRGVVFPSLSQLTSALRRRRQYRIIYVKHLSRALRRSVAGATLASPTLARFQRVLRMLCRRSVSSFTLPPPWMARLSRARSTSRVPALSAAPQLAYVRDLVSCARIFLTLEIWSPASSACHS